MLRAVAVIILAGGLKYFWKNDLSSTIKELETNKKDFLWLIATFCGIFAYLNVVVSKVFPEAGPENNFGVTLPKEALD